MSAEGDERSEVLSPGQEAVLVRARSLGFLGPGELGVHARQARALADYVGEPPHEFLDLGSGGGVPGLLLLERWTATQATLLDSGSRRCDFLRASITELGLSDRAEVAEGRAESLARDPALRARFDLVVARGFASPAVTAECAAGFLASGGRLVVTEPPTPDPGRWNREGLDLLGFGHHHQGRVLGFGFSAMRMGSDPDDRWPRRAPTKRPLWGRDARAG